MSSTNQSPHYQKAEANFLAAQTDEERLICLDEMIRECPKHKGSEKMLAQLKTRRKKLLEKVEKSKKSKKGSGKQGIKKESMQAVILGFTNSGKSTLLKALTNASPKIQQYDFTTKEPVIGMMDFANVNIQIIENPAFESEHYDRGLVHTTDTILIVVEKIEDIKKILDALPNVRAKKIIVFNNKNKDNERKISATLKSKKYNFVVLDLSSKPNLEEIKEKIFQSFGRIRIYTKDPSKSQIENLRSQKPIVLEAGATVKDAAEKILHGFSNKVKETFLTGPSGKFPNQKVGLKHKLKDLDIIEFKTK